MKFKRPLEEYRPNPVKSAISDAIGAATALPGAEIYSSLEQPPQPDWGDYGWPCYDLAKQQKRPPNQIAANLASSTIAPIGVERIDSKGPYLNFHLNRAEIIKQVCRKIFDDGDNYGASNIGRGMTIVIDFSSPNIAKPMGIGHLRSTVIGASLKRIYRHLGYRVIGINHLGDWGTQFGMLVEGYRRYADPEKMEEDPVKELYRVYVKIHEEAAKDQAIEEEGRKVFRLLEQGDPEIVELWKRFSKISLREFERIYRLLGVEFDYYTGEAFFNDKLDSVIELLERKQLAIKSHGAVIVPLDPYGLEPLLLRKSDGSSLYGTRDLAAAIYRKQTYDFDGMLYVVGVAQSLHFKQLFKTLELAGYDWVANCCHVSFGWVTLSGEMMSTRAGNVVFLEDVIERTIEKSREIIEKSNPELEDKDRVARAVGIGAVVFTDLSVRRETDVAFEWGKMLDFAGQSGPYLQYAHARLCSVLRKYGGHPDKEVDYSVLKLPEEYAIARMLLEYPEKVMLAALHDEPYIISAYLLELAGLFSAYFQKYKSPEDKILSSNEELRKARIALVSCLKTVLKSGLTLLGLETPERM